MNYLCIIFEKIAELPDG